MSFLLFSSKVILWKQDLSTVYIQYWDKNTEAISETRLEKIPEIFRIDLQKNMVAL